MKELLQLEAELNLYKNPSVNRALVFLINELEIFDANAIINLLLKYGYTFDEIKQAARKHLKNK